MGLHLFFQYFRGVLCVTQMHIYLHMCVCSSARAMDGQLCPSFLKRQEKLILFLKSQENQPHLETFSSPKLFLMTDELMSGLMVPLVGQMPSNLFTLL